MFIKGQKVNLIKHKCIGTVNYVGTDEVCIKCVGFNVWCDKNGYLPHTDVKIAEIIDRFISGQQVYAIGTINGKKVAIFGTIAMKNGTGIYKFVPYLSKDFLDMEETNLVEVEEIKFK